MAGFLVFAQPANNIIGDQVELSKKVHWYALIIPVYEAKLCKEGRIDYPVR